jgi:Cys-tRNA(Pro)/Cys-tRNA(Cys) deacylase
MPSTPVRRAPQALWVPHCPHVHNPPEPSPEQAARERGLEPEQIIRSRVFRLENGSFVTVLVAGPAKLSWPRLRCHLSISRLTTATPADVQQVIGFAAGAVSPIGVPYPMRVADDSGLLAYPTLSLGAGVILARNDPMRTRSPELGDFTD